MQKNKYTLNFPHLIATALLFFALTLILIKFFFWGYIFEKILPKVSYDVNYNISLTGYNEPVNVKSFLPVSNDHQSIFEEVHNPGGFAIKIDQTENGRVAKWDNASVSGKKAINYSFSYVGKSIKYEIDTTLIIPNSYPPDISPYLEATPNIQVNHPFIKQVFKEHVEESSLVFPTLKSIFTYTVSLTPKPFKGLTDALTAARLGEASCNGKSRLFVALSRQAGIPARLVGGIILESGQKKTSHQWVEVYLNGFWIPFDPLNNHFASLPGNYLELYTGDKFLFSHTANIQFDYGFNIKKRLIANPALISELSSHPLNFYIAWQAFERVGIPLGLLKIIIMLPLGALIVVIFRNVIGMQTFGIFLPALIAIACRQTGLGLGITAFLIVILLVSLLHFALEKINILYTPKIAIMLVFVVIVFLSISILGIHTELEDLAYITLFPIVIVTMVSERFACTIMEEGYKKALKTTMHTLVVTSFVYLAMNSSSMEAFFLAFPEAFLAIIGANIFLGRWIGLRLTEYKRFKWILK